jgi:tRNA(Ile)-lysidine synthase
MPAECGISHRAPTATGVPVGSLGHLTDHYGSVRAEGRSGKVGPHPAVATCRRAVRELLKGLDTGSLVLVASSGGADSLALAAAVAFEGPRAGFRAGAVTVDHGLQPGSAERASAVAAELKRLGLDPVEIATVTVEPGGGPEAAARYARYRALDETAVRLGAAAIFLGHTRDDQAETVLLGLARGSGTR